MAEKSFSRSALLVSLPWTSIGEPSLGLSLLKAILQRQGIPCKVLHLELFILEYLQSDTYKSLANASILNDFLFSGVLEPNLTPPQLRGLRAKVGELVNSGIFQVKEFGGTEGFVETLLKLRQDILPKWLAKWADEIAGQGATLVGFTCMFDQTIASLALSKLVRERAPRKLLALGGYAVRSPTAQTIVKAFPWIDAVCDGEGDITICQLALAAAGERSLNEVQGIVIRGNAGEPVATTPAPRVDLDSNPIPDFDDFFADVSRLSSEFLIDVLPQTLPVENSRGCWWGAKHHCSFCGIRDDDLAYRSRSAKKALETLESLVNRHGINYFRFNDYIFPNDYFKSLLPELVRLGHPYRLGTEIKSNITEARLALLAQAGFEWIQPGIESFSSDVLRRMEKGVSAAQNVYTLVLGKRFGMQVHYNILYGFPHDEEDEYKRMVKFLPRLFHLDPPAFCTRVQITRFAPLHMRAEEFGLAPLTPESTYELLFSKDYLRRTGFSLMDFCYYFESSGENSSALQRLYTEIYEIVARWKSLRDSRKELLWCEDQTATEGLAIHDLRGKNGTVHHLDIDSSMVLRTCMAPIAESRLAQECMHLSREAVREIVDELDRQELVFRDGERIVSLVPLRSHPELIGTDATNVGGMKASVFQGITSVIPIVQVD